jgi:hypothetical protein
VDRARARAGARWAAAASALLWLGCGSPPPPPEPAGEIGPRPEDFSSEGAWRHVQALAAIGPREAGSEGAKRARDYLRGELAKLGVEVTEQLSRIEPRSAPPLETVNLFATIPGESPDAILLIAPYDTPPGAPGVGANDGASGAALVLELARALEVRGPRYTLWLVFVEGDPRGSAGPTAGAVAGTRAFVKGIAEGGRMEQVRIAVYVNRVADRELRIARDLLSNRPWREEFRATGRRSARADAFPADAPFESVDAGHRAFVAVGMPRAVAIVDTRLGPDAPAPDAEGEPVDDLAHSSPESLGVVGAVCLDALGSIAERLAKIDRFVRSPIGAGQPAAEPAEPAPAPATPAESGAPGPGEPSAGAQGGSTP